MLPLARAQVPSLVRELRSYKLCSTAKGEKKKKNQSLNEVRGEPAQILEDRVNQAVGWG